MIEISEQIENELARARAKFKDFANAHEGYAVILEGLDKMWDAIKKDSIAEARSEAIQVAAMARRFVEDSYLW